MENVKTNGVKSSVARKFLLSAYLVEGLVRLPWPNDMGPFGILFIDHIEIPAKNPFGFTHVLTMMDGFTRFLIAEPVTSTEAWVTEATVWDRVICAMGRIPEIIVCDNGFDSTEWRNFCKDGPSLTAPYNPRANLVERPHQFLKALFPDKRRATLFL